MSLSKQESENLQAKFFEKRFLLIDDKITDKTVDDFMPKLFALCALSKEPVNIIFDSGGGESQKGLHLYDLIKSVPVDTNGYVVRECGSAALYPLAACKKRIGLPHSRYLFHSLRTTFTVKHNHGLGLTAEEQIEHWVKDAKYYSDRSDKVFTKDVGIPKEKLQELKNYGEKHNYWIPSEQALSIGLLTSVYDFSTDADWIWNKL